MPRTTTTNAQKSFKIHVLGAGKGESIILELPGNRWGVVDCYAPSLSDHTTNPTLKFLTDRAVYELEFLCLTHPHDDHYRGMSQLLERLRVKYFWRFPGLAARDLKNLSQYLVSDAETAGIQDDIDNANEFVQIMQLVHEKHRRSELKHKTITGHQQLYPTPFDQDSEFQITSFAPHGNQVEAYQRTLASSFSSDGRFQVHPPQVSHNDISAGLMVTFGKTRVLLGGDVEQAAWKDICPEFKEDHFHVHAVKVSHHGSETGFITDLWEKRLGKVKPVAVIAPYRRFQLPKTNALAHIVNHAARVFLTCRINGVSHAAPARTNLRSRLYLRSALKARTPAVDGGCGLCTLKFDDQGNCLDIVCVSPAYEHTVK